MDDISRFVFITLIVMIFVIIVSIITIIWIYYKLARIRRALDVNYENITSTSLVTDTVTSINTVSNMSTINELESQKANITEINSENIVSTDANINTLTSDNVIGNDVNATNLTASNADVELATMHGVTINNLESSTAVINELNSTNAKITDIESENIVTNTVKIVHADIESIELDNMNVDAIISNSIASVDAVIDNLNTVSLISEEASVDNIIVKGSSTSNYNPISYQTDLITSKFIHPGTTLNRGIITILYGGGAVTMKIEPDTSGFSHQYKNLGSTDFVTSVNDISTNYIFKVTNNSTVFNGINTVYEFESSCFLYDGYKTVDGSLYPGLIPVITVSKNKDLEFFCHFQGDLMLSLANKQSLLKNGNYTLNYKIIAV